MWGKIGVGEVDRHIEGECSFLQTSRDAEAGVNREAGHQDDIQVRPWIDPVARARSASFAGPQRISWRIAFCLRDLAFGQLMFPYICHAVGPTREDA